MSNWKEYKLGEIAEIQNGYAFKSVDFAESGIPIIKIKNIVPPNIQLNDVVYYNQKIGHPLERFIVRRNDFLISMTGSTVNQMASAVGKMGRYQFNQIALLNQRVGKIYSKSNLISDDYLYYILNRLEVQYNLALNASGSANQANISPSQIKDLKFTIPDLATQTAIAEILSSLDDKIELNNKINQELENLAQTLFKQWFIDFEFPVSLNDDSCLNHDSLDLLDEKDLKKQAVNNQDNLLNPKNQGSDNIRTYRSSGGEMVDSELGEIPKGWEVGVLSDLLTIKYGKDHKHLDNGSFPLYGSGGIMRYVEKPLYSKESILIPRKGTLSNLFYVVEPFWSVDTMFYTIIHNPVFGKYLFLIIKGLNLKSMNVGSAVPSMTTKVLNEIKIIKPSENVILAFDSQVSLFFEKLNHNLLENQELTTLRDTLLPKLISGELSLNHDLHDLLDEKDFERNNDNHGNQENPKNQGSDNEKDLERSDGNHGNQENPKNQGSDNKKDFRVPSNQGHQDNPKNQGSDNNRQ